MNIFVPFEEENSLLWGCVLWLATKRSCYECCIDVSMCQLSDVKYRLSRELALMLHGMRKGIESGEIYISVDIRNSGTSRE